jgi:Flp pilus assembly protein CpaB
VSSRRTLILIAAVVIGAISAFLVFNYVNSADDRARGNARTVQVLKIAKDISKGVFGREATQQGAVVTAEIPAEFKPVTAITDPALIQDKVAVANFATGQILVDGMFADPIENNISFAGRVSEQCTNGTGNAAQCTAITISVDPTRGVAGVIQPGDTVNILVVPKTFYCAQDTTTPGTERSVVSQLDGGQQPGIPSQGGLAYCNPARYVYQGAKVLFVDKTAIPQPGEITSTGTSTATPSGTVQTSVNTGLITLEVPAKAAQVIASIAPEDIYLTLLPQNYTPEALPKLDQFPAVLPGEDPSQLTPYGPQGFQSQK